MVWTFLNVTLYGQQSTLRCKLVPTNTPFFLDSMVVEPGSISATINKDQINYNISSGELNLNTTENDTLEICYRVFPFSYATALRAPYVENYGKIRERYGDSSPSGVLRRQELFHSNRMNTSGSISRSFSFGSNQDIFFNSQLNLQVDGELTDNLNLRASISDQNVPYQPEGNTAQIQDFDRVFIQVYNDQLSLNAGDVVFEHTESHFMKYRKNVQGGLFEISYPLAQGSASTSLGLSVAKGKFASIQLPVSEGVQGPYRIQGPNNERFIVIIS
jgi:hypothetical protein